MHLAFSFAGGMILHHVMKGGCMITKDMHIADILRLYPQTLKVFEKHNLECFECQIADFEALEHGASVHNLRIDDLLAELNSTIS